MTETPPEVIAGTCPCVSAVVCSHHASGKACAPTWGSTVGALSAVTLFAAWQGVIGADCHWLVALGDHILRVGQVPDGVPFAAAPTQGWPNLLVLAEVTFAGINRLGPSGLVIAQLLASMGSLLLIALGARRIGAGDRGAALVLLLVSLGSLPALVVVRLQLLSLVPFAALLLLLRSEQSRSSWRVWLLVPLFGVWGNMHGAVLVGFAVAGAHLAFSRLPRDPLRALAVGLLSFLALWANPAAGETWRYYLGIFGNEAARRGSELWAPPSFDSAFDILLLASAALLVGGWMLRRRPAWEYVAVAGLVAGTAITARNGLWLLLMCAAPAAANVLPHRVRNVARTWRQRVLVPAVVLTAVLGAAVCVAVDRGTEAQPVSAEVSAAVLLEAAGGSVLAPEPAVESFAAAGATVWVANPIDAFEQRDQASYLDFLGGGPLASEAIDAADLIVVDRNSILGGVVAKEPGLRMVREVAGWRLYRHAQ